MSEKTPPPAIDVEEIPYQATRSLYPEPFASQMAGRQKKRLGDLFGLQNFGVNLTRLAPNARSALRHAHSRQDEFIYVVSGHPTLYTNTGKIQLAPGMCAGFKAGDDNACNLVNESLEEALFLEIGDRSPDDQVHYPDDDLVALLVEGAWKFFHKDGRAYD